MINWCTHRSVPHSELIRDVSFLLIWQLTQRSKTGQFAEWEILEHLALNNIVLIKPSTQGWGSKQSIRQKH